MGQVMAVGLQAMDDLNVAFLIDPYQPNAVVPAIWAKQLSELDASSIDCVVDFSVPESVVTSANWCGEHHVALVVGTTGLSDEQMNAVKTCSLATGVVMAANFSIGALLSERFGALAAPYFDRVEIIELHHDRKIDAPSGTSLATARAIASARVEAGLDALDDPTTRHTLDGARGATADGGIKIHSVRLPGLTAHQEILFGGPGEGLTIRHDSFERTSFVHGVALAVRNVSSAPGLTLGIDSFLP